MTTPELMNRTEKDAAGLAEFVRAEDGWIVYEAPQSAADPQDFYSLLVDNGALAGCARFCIAPTGELKYRADIPTACATESDGSDDFDDFVANDPVGIVRDCLMPADADANVLDIGSLCKSTGWPCTERSNGRFAVELEGRSGSVSAIVSQAPNGIEVAVDLLTLDDDQPLPQQCLDAIGLFLLRLAGDVRMVRPVVRQAGDRKFVQLSVHMPAHNPALHLPHAFAALSVAVNMSRMECHALMQPALAGTYLLTNGLNQR